MSGTVPATSSSNIANELGYVFNNFLLSEGDRAEGEQVLDWNKRGQGQLDSKKKRLSQHLRPEARNQERGAT